MRKLEKEIAFYLKCSSLDASSAASSTSAVARAPIGAVVGVDVSSAEDRDHFASAAVAHQATPGS